MGDNVNFCIGFCSFRKLMSSSHFDVLRPLYLDYFSTIYFFNSSPINIPDREIS